MSVFLLNLTLIIIPFCYKLFKKHINGVFMSRNADNTFLPHFSSLSSHKVSYGIPKRSAIFLRILFPFLLPCSIYDKYCIDMPRSFANSVISMPLRIKRLFINLVLTLCIKLILFKFLLIKRYYIQMNKKSRGFFSNEYK